jgi:hypothetical protein
MLPSFCRIPHPSAGRGEERMAVLAGAVAYSASAAVTSFTAAARPENTLASHWSVPPAGRAHRERHSHHRAGRRQDRTSRPRRPGAAAPPRRSVRQHDGLRPPSWPGARPSRRWPDPPLARTGARQPRSPGCSRHHRRPRVTAPRRPGPSQAAAGAAAHSRRRIAGRLPPVPPYAQGCTRLRPPARGRVEQGDP